MFETCLNTCFATRAGKEPKYTNTHNLNYLQVANELGQMSEVRPARTTPPGCVLKAVARGKNEPSKNI
eukprot:15531447-Heterocapsa_arctica.AAC.1